MNVLETFPAFVANGFGLYTDRAPLTVKSINETFPALERLAFSSNGDFLNIELIEHFLNKNKSNSREELLRSLFASHGSDKGTTHNYYLAYARLIENPERITKIFEIGLGTNNTDIVSTMGSSGRPGASLRAFRDYCPNANVFGADFDKRILFVEEQIKTFFVDQTEIDTFPPLGEAIGSDFDLMIDDGLHAPNANLNSLDFFLPRIKIGGWAVIEDISLSSKNIWNLVNAILPNRYQCHLVQASSALMFLVNRLE